MAQTDREALGAFYNATGGPNWERNENWNTDADLSKWHGIETNDQGRVVGLSLASNNLRDPIPPELGNLRFLRDLDLSFNQLTGPIPKELGSLSKLENLYLYNNQLTGPIPKELGALSELRVLSLYSNGLTGQIPPELGKLAALEIINLWSNNLGVFSRAAAEGFAARKVDVETRRNPWKEPPASVMAKGMHDAALFLRDLDDYGRTWSNRLKIVLVGLGEAGKTTIAGRLQDRFGSSRRPTPEERTVGVEIRDIKLGSGPATQGSGPNVELDVSLWDFAGQRAYYDTHQMFLTPGALFILVVDIHAYSAENSREDALNQWLDILQSRVPGSVVLLVGTHSDLFGVNSAECSERTEGFKADVNEVVNRIRSECASANALSEAEPEKGHLDLQGNRRYQPLRVVVDEDVLALNIGSSEGRDIDLLQRRIEHLAYSGYEGYSFSSVRCVIPEPYLPAIATLEAVRRGADLRGSGGTRAEVAQRIREGDPMKRRTFIRFPEALSLFVEQQTVLSRVSKLFRQDQERRVFFEAIELHEAHGAILLARVDGAGGALQELETSASAVASANNLIIHVNPSRFADLVRRVVDVRLVDPLQQGRVVQEMKASASVRSTLLSLSDQHKRFVNAGEVSKDYLKFLWLRDMKLGKASQEAPPFNMSEEDIDVMVGSLLDIRFMFPVRDGRDAFIPDRYVVASCLPNKAGSEVNPANILELKPGCAIYSQKLQLVGAHAVPPGLVPRLLAWCGRGQGRIKACWKRGVCFAFKNHLVLLCELRADDGTCSWIECHAMGGVTDENARNVLKDVGDQVDELINDAKYGFPGLGVIRTEEEAAFSSDGEREDWVRRIASVFKDQMNVKFRVDRSMREDMAFVRWPIPRLVCVLPLPEKPLEDSDRSFEVWSAKLREWYLGGKGQGSGFATRKLRVFFLCAHDMSLAECGPKGQGYEAKELLDWVKATKPFAEVGLALATIAFNVCSGLALPLANFDAVFGTTTGGALSTLVEDSLTSGFGKMASIAGENLKSKSPADLLQGKQQEKPTPLQGFAYDELKGVIRSFEVAGMQSSSSFRSFDITMQLVDRGGLGEEWAWVRRRNSDEFVS